VIGRLKAAPRQQILNFEIKTRSHSADPGDLPYAQLPLETFLERAGSRARQISDQYESAFRPL
jgi:hypothetical protein